MKHSLAIWHYPHRTMEENIRYFSERGYDALSVHGARFAEALQREEGTQLAEALRDSGVLLTVHYALPRAHETDRILSFRRGIDLIAAWQKAYGLIKILSFDVPGGVRDRVAPYLNYVLEHVPRCLVAVEDFGLTPDERAQIEYLKGNRRFGYLVDIGHMLIRLKGQNTSGKSLFTNRYDECPACDCPGYNEFMRAMASKEFPIFEMHLHNNDGKNDEHWFLEQGVLDVSMIARVIKDMDFHGIITIESAPGYKFECKGQEADEGIMKTFAYWKECCQKK
ncbi:MAG: sugar phosphate isomerase/epimerase [Ruminococcaceae bacterium]|nr:sugar phosphate isomerase/epimerase [Oscillospiraceae bacterium]